MSDTILLGHDIDHGKKPANLDLQELVTGRTFVCGMSGSGKSHFGRYVSEHVFGKAGLIIVDVEGEYASLREKYPFLIIGKDIPLVPEAAEYLADQVLEGELSAIIDGSDVNVDEAAFQEFVQRFIIRFLIIETSKRKPYLFILEESDELAPENNFARSLCGPAILRLAKKGRKRGCGMMTITQRPQGEAKGVITQCGNKAVGKLDWPADKEAVQKFARIPEAVIDKLDQFERGDFYLSGDFIAKPRVVHIGPVETTHVGETPEVVPPAPKELAATLAKLNEQLPSIIQERLAPAVPRVAEVEARVKEKFEAQWEARVARKDKELATIRNKTEAKYEVQIADLKRKLDEAVRHATLKGGVSDVLSHPLIQKNLAKLNEKQHSFVELLETKGPQDSEHCSLFLETKPDNVKNFVHHINDKVPRLIENVNGRYASRVVKLFPVTEEAQAEQKESEQLRAKLVERDRELAVIVENTDKARVQESLELHARIRALEKERDELAKEVSWHRTELKGLRSAHQRTTELAFEATGIKPEPEAKASETSVGTPSSPSEIQVEATLHRTLTKFNVAKNTEILDADESKPIGKILACGLRGFFQQEQGISAIAAEIERKYSIKANSGGNKAVYQGALEELCAKDILDRRDNNGAWAYKATPHFNERVRPLQEA